MVIIRYLLLILFIIVSLQAQNPSSPPANIDEYIVKVMNEFEVPGISLAVVKDGKVILSKGYGTKKLAGTKPVDQKTLFCIASNTKAFTATALAMLVEEGKLDWEGAVIDYLPWLQMSDPYVTREMTIRDLLVHRSGLGLGAGDLLWWPASTYDREEIVRRLRFIPLATSFRSAYAYDNVLYLVAGEVVKSVTGQSWEEFVASRILSRIGMTGSKVRYTSGDKVATPHASVEGKVRIVEPYTSDNSNPAAGIHSNAEDMAKWMITQLDSGRIGENDRLFSSKSTRELWSPVTNIPVKNPPLELSPLKTNFKGYALGFGIQEYRGYKIVSHTGGMPGYLSRVAMIPDLKLGVTVLTNQESGAAFNSIVYFVLDYYLNAEPHDWITAYKTVLEKQKAKVATEVYLAKTNRDSTVGPSLPLNKYAGAYRDAWYGDITISHKRDLLEIQFNQTPELIGVLEHWQYDSFVARWYDRSVRGDAFVTFSLNPDGSIDQVKMGPYSEEVDFSFDYQDLLFKPVKD